ncbi:MAG TPA: DNA mismatch repair protein MutS [Treponemataceae bacterium]|nr:DNA mismatch repair protein MutS [Treponemataceae bacterium]
MSETTPMMAQYLRIKEEYRDAVLFFRLGDFYEMFNEDAREVSRLLNLTLTQRGGYPMCGIPYHASRIYIARLLRAGKKIAVCEQLSVPGPGKGLAERKVTEVITPGTALEDDYLEQNSNNYLAAVSVSKTGASGFIGFAYIDASTGEFAATSFPADDAGERFLKELGRIQPRELLVQQSLLSPESETARAVSEYPALVINRYPDWSFNQDTAYKRLCSAFGTGSLQAFSLTQNSPEVPPAGLLLEYLEQTAGPGIAHIQGIRLYGDSEFVSVDDSTRKNLELVQNLRDSGSSFTLFEVLNHTKTSMGVRLLRNWILHPLTSVTEIEKRASTVESVYRNQKVLSSIRETLSAILDIERLSGRIAMKRAHGKDLIALSRSLEGYLRLSEILNSPENSGFVFPDSNLSCAREVSALVRASILEDSPVVLHEGRMIRTGWSEELDRLHALRDNSNEVLEKYLASEREKTGITNLKMRYNRMLGYYLEVSRGNLESVPDHFIRRRSLANGDRFTTDRLVELETELNGAESLIVECEQRLFLQIRDTISEHIRTLLDIARAVAHIDVLQSFAYAATVHAWVKPSFTGSGYLHIIEGRHPVVEAHLPPNEFIPNSITLSASNDIPLSASNDESPSFALITGPNMAGKSTFLRQTALIVLMAQIGSFVPASEALLSPVDKIFCRVGATDNLARGESTFLVEMIETAHILRSATKDSLVIMDEVGRGTSTEDGLAIARAVTEFLLDHISARTLFATHYHELSRMSHPGLGNYCLDVLETDGTVVFLKKVRQGASANSYGIHVARLAGVPEPVLARAKAFLNAGSAQQHALRDAAGVHETAGGVHETAGCVSPPVPVQSAPRPGSVPELFSEEEMVLQELLSLDINALKPIDALNLVDAWKKRLYPD